MKINKRLGYELIFSIVLHAGYIDEPPKTILCIDPCGFPRLDNFVRKIQLRVYPEKNMKQFIITQHDPFYPTQIDEEITLEYYGKQQTNITPEKVLILPDRYADAFLWLTLREYTDKLGKENKSCVTSGK